MVDRVSAARFIGREPELAELEASLADAAGGRPQLVFVAGESGVGKSRLLSEFERRAESLGARAIGGECIELGEDELPYAPLVAAIRPLARDADPVLDELAPATRAELARLLPELGEAAPELGSEREGEAQRRLFDSLLALLEQLGREQPVVFWLEDIHWADRSTRSFLAFLNASLRDERLLVFCSYRSDELHRRHPVRPLLTELERGNCSRRLELSRFDRDELGAQLADILGSDPEADVVERLYARSEGNPLFTEELLATSLDGRGGLPPTLSDAVLTRLERLSPTGRRALALLAVAGRADDALLAECGELEPSELREALREAIAEHLIRVDDDGRFALRHALFREVLYDDLLPGERADLHLAFARALSWRSEAGGLWIKTAAAHHFNAAGAQADALTASVEAATAAESVNAHGEAARLLDRALALWPRVDDPGSLLGCDHADLLARAARTHYLTADDPRAVALFEQACAELEDEGGSRARLAEWLGELADALWSIGQADRARETLDRALALAPDEPTELGANLLVHQARFRFLQGRFAELEEIADQAVAMCDALGLDLVKARVLHRLGPALFAIGEPERGERALREAIELARANESVDDLATAWVNYSDVLNAFGQGERAEAMLDEAARETSGGGRRTLWIALQRAEIAFDAGEIDRSAQLIPDGRGLPRGNTRVHLDLRQATVSLARGELDAARVALEDAWETLSASVEPQYIAAVSAALAEVEARAGAIDRARAVVDEALDRIQFCTEDAARLLQLSAAAVGVEAEAAERARDVGEIEEVDRAVERAELMLERCEATGEEGGPVEAARLATARAEGARAAGSADPGLWRLAALAWEHIGRPLPRATALFRRAEALVATSDRAAAAADAATALSLAREMGATWLAGEVESLGARARLDLAVEPASAPTPTADDDADPFGLTERERQVLALVASGATNREIAAELFMAEKTASVHVSRILRKLDVRSRTEAAAVAHRQGLAAPLAG